jgi:hypothetical protein
MLLLYGLPARNGEALIAAPQGGEWLFRLDGEALGYLGAATSPQLDLKTLVAGHDLMENLLADAAVLRRAGSLDGWALRRTSEPLVARSQLTWALCQCVRGDERVALLPLATDDTNARLAALAEAAPLIVARVGAIDERTVEENSTAPVEELRYASRDDLLWLPGALARVITATERNRDAAQVEALCEEARTAGVLTEPTLARRLGCAEEAIVERLAEPATRFAYQRRSLEYIEGFGLCTHDMLARVRRAASEMSDLRDNPEVGNAWMMRTLGRRLREVTGAHEGIECLIAWLGAA